MWAIWNWKYFKKMKWKKFSKSSLSASIYSTVYRRPTLCRKWTSKKIKHTQPWDILRRRLNSVVKWWYMGGLFTFRMRRNSFGHQDDQGIEDGWECATREAPSLCETCYSFNLIFYATRDPSCSIFPAGVWTWSESLSFWRFLSTTGAHFVAVARAGWAPKCRLALRFGKQRLHHCACTFLFLHCAFYYRSTNSSVPFYTLTWSSASLHHLKLR
jgi:hypothetical protein